MSTTISSSAVHPRYQIPTVPVYRLSVAQYHAALRAGVFTDDDPIELLEGMLVFKMPKNPPHCVAVAKILRAFGAMLPTGWSLRSQDPITLDDGEPEPDIAVVAGRPEDYTEAHPSPDEVGIVIEVSDSTLERDRGIKLRSYARADIAVFWIVDVGGRRVEVYSSPDARATTPGYRTVETYAESDSIDLVLNGTLVGTLRIADLLP